MAAGMRGFRVLETERRNWDRRSGDTGRVMSVYREGGSRPGVEFERSDKVRVKDRVVEDRELGELSSGSEDAVLPREAADGVSISTNKKRKLSSMDWIDDGIHGKKAGAIGYASASISPCPSMSEEGYMGNFEVDQKLGNGFSYSDDGHYRSNEEHLLHQFEEEEEEDGVFVARNVLSSRWANVDNEDDEDKELAAPKNKSTPLKNPLKKSRKSTSPELGEILPESSVGVAYRSLGESSSSELGRRDYKSVDGESSDLDVEVDEDIVGSPETVQPPRRNINMLQGCRSVYDFERLNKISEGTYGVVYRARDKKTGEVVALKQLKMAKEREGFPLTALREINILLSFNHPSIVDVKEVVVGDCLDKIYMVMEYMDHDMKCLMESMKQPFCQSEVKCLMLQLLKGVEYLHDNWVLHRDLKTSNLLFNNHGELKICDFGLSRQYGSPLKPYTPLVVTLWYRAPELLLGTKKYSTAIDMWSLGCIMAELLGKEPLFNGKTELDQLDKIFKVLGTPNEKIWPGIANLPGAKFKSAKQPFNRLREKFPPTSFTGHPFLSERGFDLLNKLLTYDPDKRITVEAALAHEWFSEAPLPKSKGFMPTFPAKSA